MIRRGFLSDFFEGVAVKKLSVVETTPALSNQHEFNGSRTLRQLFGDADRKAIPTVFIWLGTEQEGVSVESTISWYDARRRHLTRTEYRLYYPANEVTDLMEAGDFFFLALRPDGSALIIIVPAESTIQNQLLWLFGLEYEPGLEFTVKDISQSSESVLDFATRYILEELGIELNDPETTDIDRLIERFGMRFPSTREFSQCARDSLPEISAMDEADEVLLAWLEREEAMFRRMERHVVSEQLHRGFVSEGSVDIDGFLSFSLSVQNRRKARAGQSLEHHLEAIFAGQGIRFERGALTENRNRPDFLFPSQIEYHDPLFPSDRLTMLGAKSTLKDRWRQVLAEANRIGRKHLLTLEPAISENQTDQMQAANLQLVLPAPLHRSYRENQRKWLMSVSEFIKLVVSRQNSPS